MKSVKIDILMATFNAEKYLRKQLDSIICQTYKNWRLIIRDDASRDKTVRIIESYSKRFPDQVKVIKGNINLGSKMNFAELIKFGKAEYTMFSDQDDIWLPEKINKTLNCMLCAEKKYGKKTSILVHTNLAVIGENEQRKSNSFWEYQKINENIKEFNRLLIQNNVTGCTMMINKALMKIGTPIPKQAVMHDWWFALVASVFGHIKHLDYCSVLYRQHRKNVLGAKKWGFNFVYKKVQTYGANRDSIINTVVQANKFKYIYGKRMDRRNREILKIYSNLNKYNFFLRIIKIIKYKFLKYGLIRNIGMLLTGIREKRYKKYDIGASIAMLILIMMMTYLIKGTDGNFIRNLSKLTFLVIVFTVFYKFIMLVRSRNTVNK